MENGVFKALSHVCVGSSTWDEVIRRSIEFIFDEISCDFQTMGLECLTYFFSQTGLMICNDTRQRPMSFLVLWDPQFQAAEKVEKQLNKLGKQYKKVLEQVPQSCWWLGVTNFWDTKSLPGRAFGRKGFFHFPKDLTWYVCKWFRINYGLVQSLFSSKSPPGTVINRL